MPLPQETQDGLLRELRETSNCTMPDHDTTVADVNGLLDQLGIKAKDVTIYGDIEGYICVTVSHPFREQDRAS